MNWETKANKLVKMTMHKGASIKVATPIFQNLGNLAQ